MAYIHDELHGIAASIEEILKRATAEEIKGPIQKLHDAAREIGKAASGSWLGYHANVYYRDLEPPEPGENFSPEWGLMDSFASATTGDWQHFSADQVEQAIRERAENPDMAKCNAMNSEVVAAVPREKSEILSILTTSLAAKPDAFLESIKTEVEEVETYTAGKLTKRITPTGVVMSRDTTALTQGRRTPPHIRILTEVGAIRANIEVLEKLLHSAQRAASHLKRKAGINLGKQTSGTKIFIGHGRSQAWRDLKDFIKDRLKMPHDEFNRVPVAGVPNATRLSEMLDNAAFALLVLTAEDEHANQTVHPRLNVVHEVGLFQGRLGFTKAIVLLEEGCQEFSNIEGLGQIRFPQGRISAVFEDIRLVLEREGVIEAGRS